MAAQIWSILLAIPLASAQTSYSWGELTPDGMPAERSLESAVWSPDLKGMLVFGGGADSESTALNDLHLYSSETNSWQQLSPGGSAPVPRSCHSAVWSPALKGMLVFGGKYYTGAPYDWSSSRRNDLRLYSSEKNTWEELTPSSAPAERSDHSAVWSPTLNGMLVFAGHLQKGTSGFRESNDLHLYRPENNTWEELTPGGSAPLIRRLRAYHSAVWSNDLDGMLVFGGRGFGGRGTQLFNDLHLYRPETNSWQQLTPGGSAPSARSMQSAVWSPALKGMLVFGGFEYLRKPMDFNGDGETVEVSYAVAFDSKLYLYSYENDTWEKLPGDAPAELYGHSAVWSPDLEGMLVFGGSTRKTFEAGDDGIVNDLYLYTNGTYETNGATGGATAAAGILASLLVTTWQM